MEIPGKLAQRIGLAATSFLLVSLGVWEGRRHTVYNDIGGVPTVCDGITGKGVIAGKQYSDEDCDKLIASRVDELAGEALACVHVPLTIHETVAWVHFSYNVGPWAFCKSKAAVLINQRQYKAACAQISRWTWAAGKDCRLASSKCIGLVKRRDRERAMCEGQIPVPGDP
ncbi:MAG: lysozyme [Rhodanobacteraceae bacterium]